MIIKRIAQAIKRQDISQIIIEIFIVVIGIYLGLQVSEWADDSEARVVEQRFIGYLIADLENTIDHSSSQVIRIGESITLGKHALELLEQDELMPEVEAGFTRGIRRISQSNALDSYLNSFQNGNLDQILDPSLRRTIDNFMGAFNIANTIFQNQKNSQQASTDTINFKMSTGRTEDTDLIYYDFEKLREDDEFKIAINNSIEKSYGFRVAANNVVDISNTLLPILKRYQAGEEIEEEDFR